MATAYACRRTAFGKLLIDHEGVGFMFAENLIDLQRWASMIDWCADVLDTGVLGTSESSMAKVAVPEALSRVADRCVQVMGGSGVTADEVVERFYREIRAFRSYDGPTKVHKWSLAKKIKLGFPRQQAVSSFAADNSGAEAAREGFRFDEAALDRWMRQSVGDYHGTLRVEQFRGGQSNPTFKLITSLRNYVLRRKPPGPAGRLAADRYSVG